MKASSNLNGLLSTSLLPPFRNTYGITSDYYYQWLAIFTTEGLEVLEPFDSATDPPVNKQKEKVLYLHFIFESHHGWCLHTLFNNHWTTTVEEDTQTESNNQNRYHILQIFSKSEQTPEKFPDSREKTSNALDCTAKPTAYVTPESFAFRNFK